MGRLLTAVHGTLSGNSGNTVKSVYSSMGLTEEIKVKWFIQMKHICRYFVCILLFKTLNNLFLLKYNCDACRKVEDVYKTKFTYMIGSTLIIRCNYPLISMFISRMFHRCQNKEHISKLVIIIYILSTFLPYLSYGSKNAKTNDEQQVCMKTSSL